MILSCKVLSFNASLLDLRLLSVKMIGGGWIKVSCLLWILS